MNTLGAVLVWVSLQVTLFALVGGGVYFIARRRGPSAGSLSAFWALASVVLISVLALSPWPRWWNVDAAGLLSRSSSHRAVLDADSASDPTSARHNAVGQQVKGADSAKQATSDVRRPAEERVSITAAAWDGFVSGLQTGRIDEPQPAWRWPAIVGLVLLSGVLIGLARLALGIAAVGRYRARTLPVSDRDVLAAVSAICAELGFARPIEVRESTQIDVPATIGWRRPLVLLPADWRSWSDEERRVVLVHEIAHIRRADYAAWLLAQFSVALHFFNPVVHWLAGRLRIEQEMAADHCGAQLVGGRARYLTTLAQMALRQDNDRSLSWAARPFLPVRGTFLRRIQMLRDTQSPRSTAMTWSAQAWLLLPLIIVALLVAGIRGPMSAGLGVANAAAPADKPKPVGGGEQDNGPIDLSYVPSDAAVVVVVCPAKLASREGMAPFFKLAKEDGKFADRLGLPLEEIVEIKAVAMIIPTDDNQFPFQRVVLRSKRPHDWAKFAQTVVPGPIEKTFGGRRYYMSPQAGDTSPALGYYLPDDRTLVLATELHLKQIIIGGEALPTPTWSKSWQQAANGDIAVMLDTERLTRHIKAAHGDAPRGPEDIMMATISPLWESSQRIFLGTNLDAALGLRVIAECPSEAAAEKVQQTSQAVLTLASSGLVAARKRIELESDQLQRDPRTAQEAFVTFVKPLLDAAEDLLTQAKLSRAGTTVTLESQSQRLAAPIVAAVLLPAVQKARSEAGRARSINNLKQIALAMHNYEDGNGHFPAAAVLGPDGKTPHSWRVAILPYLEQDALYKQYKLDEPWDSANNHQILSKMPAIYRAVGDDAKNTSSSYFVLTGKGALFSGNEGPAFVQITDGTSNTILAVEAKRDIPWTKPEDIAYDPGKPLPEFGGFFEGGFDAALADGSVRFLANSIDPKILHAMITKAGGEVFDRTLLDGPNRDPAGAKPNRQ